jgi:purine-binding chemotaxis protein CheW
MENLSVMEKSEAVNASNTYLNFMLGNESYGIDVIQIREVIEYNQINNLTHIPMVQDSILGVINLRGDIIPIIDLSMRIHNDKITITENTCVIVIDVPADDEIVPVGAMVDKVNGVFNLSKEEISSIPDFGIKINYEFIMGVSRVDSSFIILLDIDKVLNPDELSNMAAVEIDLAGLLALRGVNSEKSIFGDSAMVKSAAGDYVDIHNFVTLAVGQETYGIDIMNITEIIHISKMTSLPNSLPFMKGVTDVRGKMVPVVDLRMRCSLEAKEYNKKTFILIARVDNFLIGLIADTVLNVIKFPVDKIQYPPHYSARIDSDFIEGLLQIKEKVIILLNIKKILSPEEFDLIKNKDFSKKE